MANNLPVLSKDKNINMAIYAAIFALLIYVGYKVYQRQKDKKATEGSATTGTTATSGTGSTATPMAGYSDKTIFEWKNPPMKDKRVEWIQYEYNRYAKAKGQPLIAQDGSFGSQTHNAMGGLMGKKKVTYPEVKKKVDALMKAWTMSQAGIETVETPWWWQ